MARHQDRIPKRIRVIAVRSWEAEVEEIDQELSGRPEVLLTAYSPWEVEAILLVEPDWRPDSLRLALVEAGISDAEVDDLPVEPLPGCALGAGMLPATRVALRAYSTWPSSEIGTSVRQESER